MVVDGTDMLRHPSQERLACTKPLEHTCVKSIIALIRYSTCLYWNITATDLGQTPVRTSNTTANTLHVTSALAVLFVLLLQLQDSSAHCWNGQYAACNVLLAQPFKLCMYLKYMQHHVTDTP